MEANTKMKLRSLAEFESCARRTPLHYIILLIGLVFMAVAIVIDPVRHCVDYPCPTWLRGGALGLGALAALGGALALMRNLRWGSRIDPAGRAIVFWMSMTPVREQTIDVDSIARVTFDPLSETVPLRLFDRDGKYIYLPNECLPNQVEIWAETLVGAFPHIILEKK